jgi:hypothetical protein
MAEGFGSSEAGKKGGTARATKLSPEERTEIARRAALARWEKEGKPALPMATHGSDDQPLVIGNIEIPCYVLEDSTRVITNRGLQRSLGMAVSGGAQRMVDFLSVLASKGVDCKDLIARIKEPIEFQPIRGGRSAFGYEATVLADVCDALLAARKMKVTTPAQEKYADSAEILVRGFARVGIIALVDEATGYQELRDRLALQQILDMYLRKEFAAWTKRFPDEFYREIFRLKNWEWRGMKVNRPRVVATYTEDYVYRRLAPGILDELKKKNPTDDTGRRKAKHHQFLTLDVGHPKLAEHLYGLIGLMRTCDSWNEFKERVERAYPRKNMQQLMLNLRDQEDNGD